MVAALEQDRPSTTCRSFYEMVARVGQSRMISRRWLLSLVFLASLGTLHLQAQTGAPRPTPAGAPAFVGSTTCAACHQRETAAWKTSQHAAAMQHGRDP